MNTTVLEEEAFSNCVISIDMIITILRRFRSQHSLRRCQFIFVAGVILALEATVVLSKMNRVGTESNLQVLEEYLEELSYSWGIASKAKTGLAKLLVAQERVTDRDKPNGYELLTPPYTEINQFVGGQQPAIYESQLSSRGRIDGLVKDQSIDLPCRCISSDVCAQSVDYGSQVFVDNLDWWL